MVTKIHNTKLGRFPCRGKTCLVCNPKAADHPHVSEPDPSPLEPSHVFLNRVRDMLQKFYPNVKRHERTGLFTDLFVERLARQIVLLLDE